MKVTLNLEEENDSDLEDKVFEYLKKKREQKKAQKDKENKRFQQKNLGTHKFNSIEQTLANATELKRQREIEKSVFRQQVETHPIKPAVSLPVFADSSSSRVCDDGFNSKVQVILVYGCYRKHVGNAPKSLEVLQQVIVDSIKARNGKPVTPNDFRMHYYDYDGERTDIEDQYDL